MDKQKQKKERLIVSIFHEISFLLKRQLAIWGYFYHKELDEFSEKEKEMVDKFDDILDFCEWRSNNNPTMNDRGRYYSNIRMEISRMIVDEVKINCSCCGNEIDRHGILDKKFPIESSGNMCKKCRPKKKQDNYFVFHPRSLEKEISGYHEDSGEPFSYTIGYYCPYCLEEFPVENEDDFDETHEHMAECDHRCDWIENNHDKENKYHVQSCDTCEVTNCEFECENKNHDCDMWVEMKCFDAYEDRS